MSSHFSGLERRETREISSLATVVRGQCLRALRNGVSPILARKLKPFFIDRFALSQNIFLAASFSLVQLFLLN
jgi:hypothetical protein